MVCWYSHINNLEVCFIFYSWLSYLIFFRCLSLKVFCDFSLPEYLVCAMIIVWMFFFLLFEPKSIYLLSSIWLPLLCCVYFCMLFGLACYIPWLCGLIFHLFLHSWEKGTPTVFHWYYKFWLWCSLPWCTSSWLPQCLMRIFF